MISVCGMVGCLSGRQAGAARQCKFLAPMLFVWRCSPDIEPATSIIIAYRGSNTPPFVARDILAVHHQHLEAKAAAARRAGMQEDPAVAIALVPACSSPMGSHLSLIHI